MSERPTSTYSSNESYRSSSSIHSSTGSSNKKINYRNHSSNFIYSVKAFYFGNKTMNELASDQSSLDAVQKPLKELFIQNQNKSEKVSITITTDSLLISPIQENTSSFEPIELPILSLAYCGALRQQNSIEIKENLREFDTLDSSDSNRNDPPLFVTVFRSFETIGSLNCFAFLVKHDEEVIELVKLIMEIYYNIIQLQEDLDENELKIEKIDPNIKLEFEEISKPKVEKKTKDPYIKVLQDITVRKRLGLDNYEIVNKDDLSRDYYPDALINFDNDPIIINKPNSEKIVYNQNVFIRWLKPPTPAPPAPIIGNYLEINYNN